MGIWPIRLRLRIRTVLLLVALVAIAIGACRWVGRHRAYCLTRAREHESAFRWYELALAIDTSHAPSWASPRPHDSALRQEYAAVAARHREAARRYLEAANRVWMPLPAASPALTNQGGFPTDSVSPRTMLSAPNLALQRTRPADTLCGIVKLILGVPIGRAWSLVGRVGCVSRGTTRQVVDRIRSGRPSFPRRRGRGCARRPGRCRGIASGSRRRGWRRPRRLPGVRRRPGSGCRSR